MRFNVVVWAVVGCVLWVVPMLLGCSLLQVLWCCWFESPGHCSLSLLLAHNFPLEPRNPNCSDFLRNFSCFLTEFPFTVQTFFNAKTFIRLNTRRDYIFLP